MLEGYKAAVKKDQPTTAELDVRDPSRAMHPKKLRNMNGTGDRRSSNARATGVCG